MAEATRIMEESPDVDGLVVSCSALRVLGHGLIDRLEKAVRVPVVTSMQAFMWDIMREAGEKK